MTRSTIVTALVATLSLVRMGTCTNVYECGSGDITCAAGDDCVVTADEMNTCEDDIITCASGFTCDIRCTGYQVCRQSEMHLNDASSVNITCDGENACVSLETQETCDYLTIECRGNRTCSLSDFNGQGLQSTQLYCGSEDGRYGCGFSDLWPGQSMNYEIYCTSLEACDVLYVYESEAAYVYMECGGAKACMRTDIHAPANGMLEIVTRNDESEQRQDDLMWFMEVTGYEGSEISIACNPEIDVNASDSCQGMSLNASDAESIQVIFGGNAEVSSTFVHCPQSNCEVDISQLSSDGRISQLDIYTDNGWPDDVEVTCNEGDNGHSCDTVFVYCDDGQCDFEYDESEGTYACIGECGVGVQTTESDSDSVSKHGLNYAVWLAILCAAVFGH